MVLQKMEYDLLFLQKNPDLELNVIALHKKQYTVSSFQFFLLNYDIDLSILSYPNYHHAFIIASILLDLSSKYNLLKIIICN